ncbi:hypothetical protein MMC28_004904 [Mycoblastus sanguinarius]|nr:hypothetical protein [Mycoblastus sanguinarius]
MAQYKVQYTTPTVETYCSLRISTGLTQKTAHAAALGLANTLFAVQVAPSSSPDTIIGMGRMIGDGGCFFQVVDICVDPLHQGKGVGKIILKEIKDWMDKSVPKSGTVLLFADGRANELAIQAIWVCGDSRSDAVECGHGVQILGLKNNWARVGKLRSP